VSIYSVERGGRTFYVRAQWDGQRGQFTSTDVPLAIARHTQGFQYAYARTLEDLVGVGVRVYRSLEAARRQAT
jgi:hypothetical protein